MICCISSDNLYRIPKRIKKGKDTLHLCIASNQHNPNILIKLNQENKNINTKQNDYPIQLKSQQIQMYSVKTKNI
jgi:hypothetical protein